GLLLWLAITMVVIFVINTMVEMVNTFVSLLINQRMTYELGGDMFLHLQRLSLGFHSRRPVRDTIARVTGDPYCVQTLVTGSLLPLLQSIVMLVAMFVSMWGLNPTLSLMALTVVP